MTETTETLPSVDAAVDKALAIERRDFSVRYEHSCPSRGLEAVQTFEFLELADKSIEKVGNVGSLALRTIAMIANSGGKLTMESYVDFMLHLQSLFLTGIEYTSYRFPKWAKLSDAFRKDNVAMDPQGWDDEIAGRSPNELIRRWSAVGHKVGPSARRAIRELLYKSV